MEVRALWVRDHICGSGRSRSWPITTLYWHPHDRATLSLSGQMARMDCMPSNRLKVVTLISCFPELRWFPRERSWRTRGPAFSRHLAGTPKPFAYGNACSRVGAIVEGGHAPARPSSRPLAGGGGRSSRGVATAG